MVITIYTLCLCKHIKEFGIFHTFTDKIPNKRFMFLAYIFSLNAL